MGTTDRQPEPERSRRSRALLWWADTYVICAVCFSGGTWALLGARHVGLALACYSAVVICWSYAQRCRREFRRGWRRGYESAVRTMLEFQAGRTPDVELRAAVQGDPTPEPWEAHVAVAPMPRLT